MDEIDQESVKDLFDEVSTMIRKDNTGALELLRNIDESGCSEQVLMYKNDMERTLLHQVCILAKPIDDARYELLIYLLRMRMDPNVVDKGNRTPMFMLVRTYISKCDVPMKYMVALMLDWGADPSIVANNGDSVLSIAIQKKQQETIDLLLEYYPNLTITDNETIAEYVLEKIGKMCKTAEPWTEILEHVLGLLGLENQELEENPEMLFECLSELGGSPVEKLQTIRILLGMTMEEKAAWLEEWNEARQAEERAVREAEEKRAAELERFRKASEEGQRNIREWEQRQAERAETEMIKDLFVKIKMQVIYPGYNPVQTLENIDEQYARRLARFIRRDETLLHVAAERGHAKLAVKLLELGASPELEDGKERTPPQLAKMTGYADEWAQAMTQFSGSYVSLSKLAEAFDPTLSDSEEDGNYSMFDGYSMEQPE